MCKHLDEIKETVKREYNYCLQDLKNPVKRKLNRSISPSKKKKEANPT